MRGKTRDLLATILVAAIAVPYIGYLVNGDMPLIQDPREMSATGLVLGVLAFQVLRRGDAFDRLGKIEIGLGLVSLALGLVALILAETAAAEILLAVFMGSILVVWAVELMDHVGILHGAHSTALRHP
jgi:Na+-transporting NADH:ubiquinone oxidoreductase subunit NqrB